MAELRQNGEHTEAQRLEALWGGEFGNAYVERNQNAAQLREAFWQKLVADNQITSAMEVGCNLGGNLYWLAKLLPPGKVWGIDVNARALRELRTRVPDANAVLAPGREIPYRDRWFDLTFTMGVLIHMPEATLPLVMAEIVRCSRRFVFCGEYFGEQTMEVPYRGQPGSMFKRNYGALYAELFPELRLRESGELVNGKNWDDDVTWWLFEKT